MGYHNHQSLNMVSMKSLFMQLALLVPHIVQTGHSGRGKGKGKGKKHQHGEVDLEAAHGYFPLPNDEGLHPTLKRRFFQRSRSKHLNSRWDLEIDDMLDQLERGYSQPSRLSPSDSVPILEPNSSEQESQADSQEYWEKEVTNLKIQIPIFALTSAQIDIESLRQCTDLVQLCSRSKGKASGSISSRKLSYTMISSFSKETIVFKSG